MSHCSIQHNLPYHRITASTSAAIGWVSAHLDRFSPFDEHDAYCPTRTKPFIELAIMLSVYAAATTDARSPIVRRAATLFQNVSKRADFTDWIIRLPAEIVNYAELCAAVNELGGNSRELRERLQSAVDMGILFQVERLPHRQIELRAALDWAGVTHSLPPLADLCAKTILGQPLFAPLLSDSAIYAITHVIIFASRFGLVQSALPAWLRSETIRTLLSDLIVVASQERNWDLLGELFLCWDSMRFEHNGVTVAGWESFLEICRPDGAVPPRSVRDEKETTKDAGEISDFDHVYHTTLVAALAGVVFMHRARSSQSASLDIPEESREVKVNQM